MDQDIRFGVIMAGWWFGTFFIFPYIGNLSSSQLTNSYFSEGWVSHQPVLLSHHYPIIIHIKPYKTILKPYIWNHQPVMVHDKNPAATRIRTMGFSLWALGWAIRTKLTLRFGLFLNSLSLNICSIRKTKKKMFSSCLVVSNEKWLLWFGFFNTWLWTIVPWSPSFTLEMRAFSWFSSFQ